MLEACVGFDVVLAVARDALRVRVLPNILRVAARLLDTLIVLGF